MKKMVTTAKRAQRNQTARMDSLPSGTGPGPGVPVLQKVIRRGRLEERSENGLRRIYHPRTGTSPAFVRSHEGNQSFLIDDLFCPAGERMKSM